MPGPHGGDLCAGGRCRGSFLDRAEFFYILRYVQRVKADRPLPLSLPPLQMDNVAFREKFRRLLTTRPVDDTPWRYDLDPEAAKAYVEEIRRRQPSAFRK